MSCAHTGQFKAVADCKPREGFGFELKVFVTCMECGTPMKFLAKQEAGLDEYGLVAKLICEPAGD